jgi:hypothetical protein
LRLFNNLPLRMGALPPGLKWTFDRQSCSLALTIAYNRFNPGLKTAR